MIVFYLHYMGVNIHHSHGTKHIHAHTFKLLVSDIFVFSLNYFPLEGVLAERLFATFDKDKNNVIDYEEFLGEFSSSTVYCA